MVITDVKKIISEVAGVTDAERTKKTVETAQIVVFDLENEEYAIKIQDIQEIIEMPKITPIPSAPEFIRGIVNLRGKIVVIIDLEKRFSISRDENREASKHIIISEIEGSSYGIIVDRVKEVLRVDTEAIQSTPDLLTSKIEEDFFDGVIVLEKDEKAEEQKATRLIILLNIRKLLEEKDLFELKETIKAATKEDDQNKLMCLTMQFNPETLQKAATLGSQEASKAFAKLSSEKVDVSVSEVSFVAPQEVAEAIAFHQEKHPIVAYAQMITGIDGIAILAMTRDEALNLVDLLNNKPIGTTGILMDIDRSAIKETLNIISNSFLTSLAKHSETTLFFGDPHLISTPSLSEMLNKLNVSKNNIIIFKTKLEVAQHDIAAQLYLLFDSKLSSMLNNI